MLRSAEAILGYKIQAVDGEIGHVSDFYFDDQSWAIRYLVVKTGSWLFGREVLLSPLVLKQPDWVAQTLPVNLTRKQVENSPPVDLAQPVSRQQEEALQTHYNWDPYWMDFSPRPMPVHFNAPASAVASAVGSTADSRPQDVATLERKQTRHRIQEMATADYNSHLRSMDEVTGYTIAAADGGIGHVETFIIDDAIWSIMYLVVDTRNWLPGKKVLVALDWVTAVDWAEQQVAVNLQRETIKESPEYDPGQPVNRAVETNLYDYYGRPAYWN